MHVRSLTQGGVHLTRKKGGVTHATVLTRVHISFTFSLIDKDITNSITGIYGTVAYPIQQFWMAICVLESTVMLLCCEMRAVLAAALLL